MRNRSLLVHAGATLALLLSSGLAEARVEYMTAIPNSAVDSCNSCHPGGNTAALTDFGTDTNNLVGTSQATWWGVLWNVDSDGDGQTNGQELGDPCNDFVEGGTPGRTTDISNPGDPADLSGTPDDPPCDPGTGGGGPGGTTSGTTGAGAGSSGAGAGSNDSSGAGMAEAPPPIASGACAVEAAPGSGEGGAPWAWAAAGAVAALLGASRVRRRRPIKTSRSA